MNKNYWVRSTDDLVIDYYGLLCSELVPGCKGVVLRHSPDDHTVDMAWLGSKRRDEIEHRVPLDTLVFDVQGTGAADHVARRVASKISSKHGRHGEEMHEKKSVGPAQVLCVPHRHGGGGSVSVDFVCEGCQSPHVYEGRAFQFQESLLPYVDGKYVGEDRFSPLHPGDNARLPDGSRRVDRRALAILARILFNAEVRKRNS